MLQSPEGGRLIEVGLNSPLLCCCFTAGRKSSLNLSIEINKQKTAVERGHQFFWFIFYKKRKTYLGKIEATLLGRVCKKHLVRGQQSAEGFNSAIHSHLLRIKIKQNLRRYGQLFEFSEFPWHILRHIFLPQDRKQKKKTAKSFSRAIKQARKKHF